MRRAADSHSGIGRGFLESILVREDLISRILRFLVCVGVTAINDLESLSTPPTKACVKAQELDYRHIKGCTRAALLSGILAHTRITRCLLTSPFMSLSRWCW